MSEPTLTTKGAATRQAILESARDLLVTAGYDALVMRDVAQRCGIKLGNLQYYFATRDELLIELIDIEAEQDLQTIESALQACEDEDALRRAVEELVERWRGDGGTVYTVLNMRARQQGAFGEQYQRIYANHYAALERALACTIPDLATDERKVRVRLLAALVDGAAYQTGVGRHTPFGDRLTIEALRIAGCE